MGLGASSFDELNSLVGYKRSTPYEQWFGEMALSEAQIQERIRFAERFEEELEEELAYLFYAYPTIKTSDVEDLKSRYLETLMIFGLLPINGQYNYQQQQLYDHAERFAAETIASTQAHQDTPYYYSEDRARFMSANETNIVYNTDDFWSEVEAGATKKTWITMQDNKVRESHMEIDGETKDIDEPFYVGGSLMLFPGDESLGAGAEEIVNCRCQIEFSGYADGTSMQNAPLPLSPTYVDKTDQLYANLKMTEPETGFEDVGAHGTEFTIQYTSNIGVDVEFSAREFANVLRNDPNYHGGDIRLLSCNTGKDDNGFAQQLADEMHVVVKAPTETLWTKENGELFISDNEILADMWYDGEKVKETGTWKFFYPREKRK